MGTPRQFFVLLSVATMLASACGPGANIGAGAGTNEEQRPAGPKRIVGAVFGAPFTVSVLLAAGGTGNATPGTNQIEKFVNVGFTDEDDQGSEFRGSRRPRRPPITVCGAFFPMAAWR